MSRRELLRKGAIFGAFAASAGTLDVASALANARRPAALARSAAATVTYATSTGIGPYLSPLIKRFDQEYAPLKANLMLLSGNYEPLMATRFAAGARGIDVVYSDPGYAELWYKSGWIQPLDGLPGLKQLNADVLGASTRNDLFASDGKQIAIPYYSGLDLFVYNSALLKKHDVRSPTTWDDLTAACVKLKKAGIQYPLALFWNKDFAMIIQTFLAHCASDGMTSTFTAQLEPTFDRNPVALEVLERWRKWYAMGLVSQDVLTGNYSAVSNLFASGKAAFSEGSLQFVKPWQTTKHTAAYGNTAITLMPGRTHASVTYMSKYHMAASASDRDATWEFMKYLAWKDPHNKGAYTTPINYLVKGFALTAPYKGLLESPAVKHSFSFLDYRVLQEQSAKAPNLFYPADRAVWFNDFQNNMSSILQDAILGNISPAAALKQSADYARSRHGK